MKVTEKQEKMLDTAFDSKDVKEMSTDEYNEYVQFLLTISLSTIISRKGHAFAAEFVRAGLNSPENQIIAQQVKHH